MKLRNAPRWCAPVVLIAALMTTGPASQASIGYGDRLPPCAAAAPATHPPTSPAGPYAPGACRARGPILESGVQLARPVEAGFTPVGYHHLGANTGGEWSGVSGRISVVHGSVRPRSYDFVA